MKFYNRKTEIEALKCIEERSVSFPQMTVITGRRRIGKTALIRHAFGKIPFLYFFVARKSEAMLCEELGSIIHEVLHEDLGDFTSFLMGVAPLQGGGIKGLLLRLFRLP